MRTLVHIHEVNEIRGRFETGEGLGRSSFTDCGAPTIKDVRQVAKLRTPRVARKK